MAALGMDIPGLAPPRRAAAWLARAGDLALPAAAIALIFAAWEWGVALLGIGAYLLPPPSQVFAAIATMARDGSLWANAQVTLGATLTGFAIALAAGIAVGGLIAQSRLVERTVYGYLVAIQTLPKIALAPLFVAWFGFGLSSKVAVAALIAFFPIVVNVIAGLKSCDPGRLDVMRALSASRWQVFRHVQLPSALPFIMAGADVAIVFALTGAMVGEFVGATAGLGYQMVLSNSQMEVPKVYGVLVVLGGIGMLLHGAVALLRRRLLSWMPAEAAPSSPSRS
ncbi:ABC transporter permease [Pseudorhodoferax soli]|uniref:NitT/TauT family transport system permease protein n=1 Tax=Pseudorhodoferax soli TaxID=545864 RepID=A0A368XVQ3_9BURK|nr:ABC transporter permease [Pseudorhodoferax soli]RCW70587.1 NitT/TauT family transport system permease protein [Pseudorhodoferax soli]